MLENFETQNFHLGHFSFIQANKKFRLLPGNAGLQNIYYVYPRGGVDILFLLFPPSGHLVSAHLKEKCLSYLYQIWYGCVLGLLCILVKIGL